MKLTDAIVELKAKIGSETEIGPWLEMTQERINDFAKLKVISSGFILMKKGQKQNHLTEKPLHMDSSHFRWFIC